MKYFVFRISQFIEFFPLDIIYIYRLSLSLYIYLNRSSRSVNFLVWIVCIMSILIHTRQIPLLHISVSHVVCRQSFPSHGHRVPATIVDSIVLDRQLSWKTIKLNCENPWKLVNERQNKTQYPPESFINLGG